MKKRQILWNLLMLFFSGTVSFKYFWNYDYSLRWISITHSIILPGVYETLVFNEHLKLIGENIYKVVDNNSKFVNKEIKNPKNEAMYTYMPTNIQHDKWEFVLK